MYNRALVESHAAAFIGGWVWKILVLLLQLDVGRISKVNDRASFLHISSLPEPFHSFCKKLSQLSTVKGTCLLSSWQAKQGPGNMLMEMEMPALLGEIAAIFSAPTYCLSKDHRRRGEMDRVPSLIGSKSKPHLLSPSFTISVGQSEGGSASSHLKAHYFKVTAATADIQEDISSLFIQFFFLHFEFYPGSFFTLHPLLPCCLSPTHCCDLSLGINLKDVFIFFCNYWKLMYESM